MTEPTQMKGPMGTGVPMGLDPTQTRVTIMRIEIHPVTHNIRIKHHTERRMTQCSTNLDSFRNKSHSPICPALIVTQKFQVMNKIDSTRTRQTTADIQAQLADQTENPSIRNLERWLPQSEALLWKGYPHLTMDMVGAVIGSPLNSIRSTRLHTIAHRVETGTR